MSRNQIITQDAFSVAPHLLGLPLASPSRRACAMLLDLIIVAALIKTGPALFGFAAAFVLWRIGDRGFLRTLFRIGSAVFVAMTLATWGFVGGDDDEDDDRAAQVIETDDPAADDNDVGPSASSIQQLAAELAEANQNDSTSVDSLRKLMTQALGGRDLQQLERRIRQQNRRIATLQSELAQARESRGVRSFVAGISDDLGLGFGWMALYFTAFLAMMRGQTPGKKVAGLRVVRLDAKPITWFIAFERFGGYAASATLGLLGFLQILWDRNRQGLHDKAVETVVIREAPDPHPQRLLASLPKK